MPYKFKKDKLANDRLIRDLQQFRKWESMGLRMLPNQGELECEDCGRVTPRICADIYRHFPECSKYVPWHYWYRGRGKRRDPLTSG